MTPPETSEMRRPAAPPAPTRGELVRDVLVFQGKLALDGFRDLVLGPISLIAALADLVIGRQRPKTYFYGVVASGRRTEGWINLFGAADRVALREPARPGAEGRNLDALVDRLEALVREQYNGGGMTASAKNAIEGWLDGIPRRGSS